MEAARPIIERAQIDGFGFDVELLFLAQRAGLRLREVPVRWNHHEGSKVHIVRDSLRMFSEVVSLRRRIAREAAPTSSPERRVRTSARRPTKS